MIEKLFLLHFWGWRSFSLKVWQLLSGRIQTRRRSFLRQLFEHSFLKRHRRWRVRGTCSSRVASALDLFDVRWRFKGNLLVVFRVDLHHRWGFRLCRCSRSWFWGFLWKMSILLLNSCSLWWKPPSLPYLSRFFVILPFISNSWYNVVHIGL